MLRAESAVNTGAFSELSLLLDDAVRDGVFPGAVALIGLNEQIIYCKAFGYHYDENYRQTSTALVSVGTVYDIGSLTSAIVTSTLVMKLVEDGKIKLEDRISRYIQSFGVSGKSAITVAQVLSHTAGLPAQTAFYEELIREHAGARMGILTSRGAKEYVYNALNRLSLKYTPGTKQLYSEVGFILLGELVEVLTGLSLDRACCRYITQPLGLKSTSFIDLSLIRRRGIHPVRDIIAPTEDCTWRKRVLCGEVQDDNAWAMGGISGHAGLFTTVHDLHAFSAAVISSCRGANRFLKRDTLRLFWRGPDASWEEGWRFGWEVPSRDNGLNECGFSQRAVGQCGSTGCSLWLEPERGLDIILLSNRVHPSRHNKKIRAFRNSLHSAALRAVPL